MNRPRVVFCAYDNPGNVSGPNVWLRRLLPQLGEVGLAPEAWFFSLDVNESPTSHALERAGVPTRSFPFRSHTRAKVKWLLQQASVDPPIAFIPNLVVPAFFAAQWLRQAGIPTVGVIHSDDPFYHAVAREFAGESEEWRVSDLVCVSRYLQSVLAERIESAVRYHTIPYGVPVPDAVPRQAGDTLELLYVGRLEEEQKRVSDVARALCRAVREVPGVRARMIGDGPAFPTLRQLICNHGCERSVELTGRIDSDRIQEEMSRSHAIVLLSDYEGLPIALLEGMACGLVPICTRIESGIPELVRHGENGLLVDDRGDGFVAAVRTLRESNATLARLSTAARNTVKAGYNLENAACQWRELLLALAQEYRPQSHIVVPDKILLPPAQPEFAREDYRTHHILARATNRLKRLSPSA